MKKKVVFVDYFDTIVHRYTTYHNIYLYWANIIKKIFNLNISINDLVECRNSSNEEINFESYQNDIYENIKKKIPEVSFSFDSFKSKSVSVEESLELLYQYPNKKMLKRLKKMHDNGCYVYVVSDYHLSKSTYDKFLKKHGIDFVDDVFISCDLGETKRSSKLYLKIMDSLNINKQDVIMFGDNKVSDSMSCKKIGIQSRLRRNYLRKLYSKLKKYDLKKVMKIYSKELIKNNNFSEYSFILATFCKRLKSELGEDFDKKIAFISREGITLKFYYDNYLEYFNKKMNTHILYNSRLVNKKLDENNAEYNDVYRKYMSQFLNEDNTMYFVDSGWNASSQICVTKELNCSSFGYYVGLFINDEISRCNRKGLIFNINANGKSKYYSLFRTHCSLYEYILAANIGTTINYEMVNNSLKPIMDYNESEKSTFDMYVSKLQDEITNSFEIITPVVEFLESRDLNDINSFMMFHSLFRVSKEKKNLYNSMMENSVDSLTKSHINYNKENKKNINMMSVLFHPYKNLNAICKIPYCYNSIIVKLIYKYLSVICKISMSFCERRKRGNDII